MADDLPSGDSSAVLSDVDDDDEPPFSPPPPTNTTSDNNNNRIRDLLAELDHERSLRRSAEDSVKKRDEALSRLKAFAQDIIYKRDEILKDRDDVTSKLSEALREKDALRSEAETASQMMASGIEKISAKVSRFKAFEGFPKSKKYATGLPAVAYGVIKRANDIAEELLGQVDALVKERNQAREQVDHRNYEIAIEVSQLEATIAEKEKVIVERDAKVKELEMRMEAQRPVIIDQLKNVSKTYGKLNEILVVADGGSVSDQTSSFVWEEMDVDRNLQALSEGILSVHDMANVVAEKMKEQLEGKDQRICVFEEKVNELVAEKQHIGTLLRSALSSKTNEVLQVAESGLREAGIELKFDDRDQNGGVEEDEVYTLAGALENTVKASKLQIVELQHLVTALRAESSLHKSHLDAQTKEISQLKLQIKELEKKELVANESIEGLMTDIAAAEEEIARWKAAAEQEAAAGRAVEQEFLSQLSTLKQELDETKQNMSELENKLKFKEETAAAAMAARDAAENSLRLADVRSTRLRERVEELNRQLEANDTRIDSSNAQNSHRYVCWPWNWLGLNIVGRQPDVEENSNEMELSEPLII